MFDSISDFFLTTNEKQIRKDLEMRQKKFWDELLPDVPFKPLKYVYLTSPEGFKFLKLKGKWEGEGYYERVGKKKLEYRGTSLPDMERWPRS